MTESSKEALLVTFRSMAGESHTVQLHSGMAVSEAKEILEEKIGIPRLEQRLLCGTAILDDEAKPFLQISRDKVDVQVLRQPRMTLEQFRKELGHGEDPFALNILLQEAVRLEEPHVALEIVYHPDFADLDIPIQEKGNMFKTLAVSGFAAAFEALLQHERVGEVEGVLDAGFAALHHAASRGLVLHCQHMLNSPHFHTASGRKSSGTGNGTTALHHAANETVLEVLLKSPDLSSTETLNATDRFGCTCLHYANTAEMCRIILGQPNFSSINLQDHSGQTALHRASSPGVCAEIIKDPSFDSLRCLDSLGRTAVHVLVRSEQIATVMLKNPTTIGADLLDVLDTKGRSALHFAASGRVCDLLFAGGFTEINALDKQNQSALHTARNASVAKAILEHPNFNQLNAWSVNTETALSHAAAISNDDLVVQLLKHPGHQVESLQAALDVSWQLQPETKLLLEQKLQDSHGTSSHICHVL